MTGDVVNAFRFKRTCNINTCTTWYILTFYYNLVHVDIGIHPIVNHESWGLNKSINATVINSCVYALIQELGMCKKSGKWLYLQTGHLH